jgi:hypothetical protein
MKELKILEFHRERDVRVELEAKYQKKGRCFE